MVCISYKRSVIVYNSDKYNGYKFGNMSFGIIMKAWKYNDAVNVLEMTPQASSDNC